MKLQYLFVLLVFHLNFKTNNTLTARRKTSQTGGNLQDRMHTWTVTTRKVLASNP
jgi:hypothetical protein